MLTKAADTKFVKDNWEIFSSDDPNTPMRRAFQAHTLMRKDGDAHIRERTAMAAAFSPRNLRNIWTPIYEKVADEYVGRLPRGETVDLFSTLAASVSARTTSIIRAAMCKPMPVCSCSINADSTAALTLSSNLQGARA